MNAPTQANDTMQQLLDHPMVQAGVAPLVVALLVAAALWRTRLAWLAVVAGFATAASLSAGISVSPLTAGRKVTLLVLLSPLVGLVLDRLAGRAPRWLPWAASAGCGLSTLWVFASLLGQREGTALVTTAVGLVVFVGVQAALTLRLREDGAAGGAAGVAGGLGVGIAAVLSASIGYLTGGVGIAAAAGALLLLQFVFNQSRAPGYAGLLPIGFGLALFAAATTMLAQLPAYALPLLWAVPLLASWRVAGGVAWRTRLALTTATALAGALPLVLAAWFAARAGSSSVS